MPGQDVIEPFQPDRHDRDPEPRRDHPDAGLEAARSLRSRCGALREYQNRRALPDELADVAQRLPRAGATLRQREGVEEDADR